MNKPPEKYAKPINTTRQDHILRTTQRKIINRKNYKQNLKKRKVESLSKEVENIRTNNIVVNLSDLAIPDIAYIYLAHGLNYVDVKKS